MRDALVRQSGEAGAVVARAGWALLVIGTLCGALGCRGMREMRGQAWASGDRTTYVYARGDDLVAVRGDARKVFAAGAGCLVDSADRVFVSDDGRRAVALGWRATGGSIHHHVSHEVSLACVLDLDTGATRALAEVYPGLEPGRSLSQGGEWTIGARTGWVYRRSVVGPHPDVYDGKGATASLAFTLGNDDCDIVERADAIVVGCARYREVSHSPDGVVYRYWIDLAELDPAAFPPRVLGSRAVDVVRADGVRLSRDGRRLAWWHSPFDAPAVGGVLDTASGRQLAAIDGAHIVAVDFDASAGQLAVLDRPSRTSERAVVRRLALAGSGLVERERLALAGALMAADLYWLADGRILVSGFGGSQLLTPGR